MIQTDSLGVSGVTGHDSRLRFGMGMRAIRQARGMPRSMLARKVRMSVSHLRNIENGHRQPDAATCAAIDSALDADGLLEELCHGGDNEVKRRTILQSISLLAYGYSTPSTDDPDPDSTDLHILKERLEAYRSMDNAYGGSAVRDAVSNALNFEALPLLKSHGHSPVARDLQQTTAELAQLAGWTAYDSGLHSLARRHFKVALELAVEAHDDALSCEILAARAHQAAFLQNGDDATQLAQSALRFAVRSGLPSLVSEVYMSSAHGYALQNDTKRTYQSLRLAEDEFSKISPDNDPAWAKYLCDAYLHARTGHTLLAIGEHHAATECATASLTMNNQTYVRGHMFNLSLLAESSASTGDIERATDAGTHALALAHKLRSQRSHEYLRRLAVALVPYRSNSEVSGLIDGIACLLPKVQHSRLQPDNGR